ncbi:MAG: AMP-binding protein [Alphaproteobacteria bacterium]|nr:AMP-binding protein [Alphaproteobacteria bacterium]
MSSPVATAPFATVYEAFRHTAAAHPENAFLAVPRDAKRDYHPDGFETTYGAAAEEVERLIAQYRAAGYGIGHRVALMLDNRPEHFLHMLALNALGVSQVPVNPYYLHHELSYQLTHSEVDLAIGLASNRVRLEAVAAERAAPLPIATLEDWPEALPAPARPAMAGTRGRKTETAVIYTSGTTGRPKGCLIDNDYMIAVGQWYAEIGGRLTLEHGRERLFVPLPVFHVNAGINTPTALILTANCLIMPDRFHPSTWWRDLAETRATGLHYLGVVPTILLKAAPCPEETQHRVKFGLGAGVDPDLHAKFEERFGIPMVEVWGMSETGRFFADCHEPRQIHTRAFGRPTPDFEAKVVDDAGREVPRGTPGELVVRSPEPEPRKGFFAGYLKDPAATEEVWRGGWFHTGDVVTQAEDGMLHFVERKKNIIRRSGENISAAEVENALIDHAAVGQIAVMPVADELRDEEVLACVVPAAGWAAGAETARAILEFGRTRCAYYKLPGWIVFLDDLPRTGTEKIQKHLIFPGGQDPRAHAGAVDLRALKKRQPA